MAEQPELRLHAFGATLEEALQNLREEIVEHRDRLEELGDQVSRGVRQDRELLRGIIVRDA